MITVNGVVSPAVADLDVQISEVVSGVPNVRRWVTTNAQGGFTAVIDPTELNTTSPQLAFTVFQNGHTVGTGSATWSNRYQTITISVSPDPAFEPCSRRLIRGKVYHNGDDAKVGLPEVQVELWERNATWSLPRATATTDANGQFGVELREGDFATTARVIDFKVYINGVDAGATGSWDPSLLDNVCEIKITAGTGKTVVTGYVRTKDAVPQANVTVKALALELSGEVEAASTTTDVNGFYSLVFVYAGSRLDVTIKAFNLPSTTPIAQSELYRNLLNGVDVDLVIGNEVQLTTSEFATVLAAVNATRGATAAKDLTPAQVTSIATKYNLSAELVQLFVDASRAVGFAGSGLTPELFYGIGRRGRKGSLTTVLAIPPADRAAAINAALQGNVLPAAFQSQATTQLATLDGLRSDLLITDKATTTATRLAGVLAVAGVTSTSDQKLLLNEFLKSTTSADQFWAAAPTNPALSPTFTAQKLTDAKNALHMGIYTMNYPPLVQSLWSSGYRSASDLAKVTDWSTRINTVGSPVEVNGANAAAQAINYSQAVASLTATAFPATAIPAAYTASPISSTTGLQTFFVANSTRPFDFTASSVAAYARVPANSSAFDSNPTGRAQLEQMSRLFNVSPKDNRYDAVKALWNAGFNSARSIYLTGKAAFVSKMTVSLGADVAAKVYDKAAQTHGMAMALVTQAGASFAFPGVGGAIPQQTTPPSTIPDWATLFGSVDYCSCDECQSVFGPGAYLADVLTFLETHPTSGTPALTTLRARRPEIMATVLSCTNTNTALPQIDLVNEILEPLVSGTAAGPYQTTGAQEDLATHPEHLQPGAYHKLAGSIYPWSLPYNLWVDEMRSYLGLMNLSLADLCGAFLPDPLVSQSYMLELAQMVTFQRDTIAVALTDNQWVPWGYTTLSDWITDITSLPTFLSRSGLSLDDASQVISTAYVQASGGSPLAISLPPGVCDLSQGTIVNPNANALERLHRFVRLWRSLGWTVRQVDRIIKYYGQTALDMNIIPRLLIVLQKAKVLNLSVDETLVLLENVNIDTVKDPILGTSAYTRMFQSRTVSATTNSAFDLNGTGTELANTTVALSVYYGEVAAGLGTDVPSINAIFAHEGTTSPKLTLANLSTLYRYVLLARGLGISVPTLLTLLTMGSRRPFYFYQQNEPLYLRTDLEHAQSFGYALDELYYVLFHQDTAAGVYCPTNDAIAGALKEMRDALKLVAAPEDSSPSDPVTTKNLLLSILPTNPTDLVSVVDTAVVILDGTTTSVDKNAFIAAYFAPFVDVGDAQAKLAGASRLEPASARYAYLQPKLQAYAARKAIVVERLSSAFKCPTSVMDMVLRTYVKGRKADGTVDTTASALTVFTGLDSLTPDPSTGLLTPAIAGAAFMTYLLIQKVGTATGRMNLAESDLSWTFNYGPMKLDQLPVTPVTVTLPIPVSATTSPLAQWSDLVNAVKFRAHFDGGRLFDLLESAASRPTVNLTTERDALLTQLANRAGWDTTTTLRFAALNFPTLLPLSNFTVKNLYQLKKEVVLAQRLGVSADTLSSWRSVPGGGTTGVSNGPDVAMAQAFAIKQAVRSVFDPTKWHDAAKSVRDAIRGRQRDGLVSFLVRPGGAYPDVQTLSDSVLFDVLVGPCAQTSRVKFAIGCTQTFAQRIFLNLEQPLSFSIADESQWEWMKNYRVWEANQQILMYPENWLEPELRDDKSPLFKALETTLAQQELTDEAAEDAVADYLSGLEEVANLEIVASVMDVDDETKDTKFHVVGRTRTIPHTYYYRIQVNGRYWTAWDKIDLDIQGDHILLSIYGRRPYLLWAVIAEAPRDQSGPTESLPPPKYEMRLRWSALRNGKWIPTRQSRDTIMVPPGPNNVLSGPDLFERLRQETALHTIVDEPSDDLLVRAVRNNVSVNEISDPDSHVVSFHSYRWDKLFRVTGGQGIAYSENESEPGAEYVTFAPKLTKEQYQWLASDGGNGLALPDAYTVLGWRTDSSDEVAVLNAAPTAYHLSITPGDGYTWMFDPIFFQDNQRCFVITSKESDPPPTTVDTSTHVKTPPVETTLPVAKMWSQNKPNAVSFINPTGTPVPGAGLKVLDESRAAIRALDYTAFTFAPFYHPFVRDLMTQLHRWGVDGVLNPQPGKPGAPLRRQQLSQPFFVDTYAPTAAVDSQSLPVDEFDFDSMSAYGPYNWELFFHIPLLIANKLATEQRFEESRKWFHYIFNPTEQLASSGTPEPTPQRYWKTKPFYALSSTDVAAEGSPVKQIELLLSYDNEDPARLAARKRLLAQIDEWRSNPFSPHAIARLRPTAYMKSVVTKYLDMLIAWGDQLFGQNTIESINEATQLYTLALAVLGKRPVKVTPLTQPTTYTYDGLSTALDKLAQAVYQVECALPPGQGDAPSADDVMVFGKSLIFCVPPNDKLLGYWDTVDDRLYKIRHCLSLDGTAQQLPLFEAPINPALLVRAAAAGVDISSLLAEVSAPLPLQRYAVFAQRANELVGELKSLGSSFLSALEKRDAEALAALRAGQEYQLLSAIQVAKQAAIDEAQAALDGLGKSRESAVLRSQYYGSRTFTNGSEDQHINSLNQAMALRIVQQYLQIAAGAASATPEAQIGTSGTGSHNVIALGPTQAIGAIQFVSGSLGMFATAIETQGQLASINGGYERRWDDWQHQKALADKDIEQLDAQIKAAGFRLDIAKEDFKNHMTQVQNAMDVRDFMRDKYTNTELYDWMVGQLAAVYFQTYKLAYDLAKKAERAWQFELADTTSSFISFGYWDSLRKGLLSGDKLALDLKRMDAAYLDKNKREYELTRHIPLSMFDPMALQALRTQGSCQLNIPEAFFDMDSPGHYLRRIKHVSLTISGTTGPYTPVRCKLTLNSSSVRMKPTTNPNDLVASNVAVQSIVTSSAQDDGGLFETNLRDERYLPFEGAGAVSAWSLELPTTVPLFDRTTISEVVLHVRYTARDGGVGFRDQVTGTLKHALNGMPLASSRTGLYVGLSVRSAFSDAWQQFIQGNGATPPLSLALDLSRLPIPVPAGATIKQIDFVALVADPSADWNPLPLTVTPAPDTNPVVLNKNVNLGQYPSGSAIYTTPSSLGPWTITCPLNGLSQLAAAQDLYLVVSYMYPETL